MSQSQAHAKHAVGSPTRLHPFPEEPLQARWEFGPGRLGPLSAVCITRLRLAVMTQGARKPRMSRAFITVHFVVTLTLLQFMLLLCRCCRELQVVSPVASPGKLWSPIPIHAPIFLSGYIQFVPMNLEISGLLGYCALAA